MGNYSKAKVKTETCFFTFLVTIFLSFFLNSSEMEEKREVEVQSLKKGNFAFIRSQPCRITEVTKKPKASVKGNERIYIVGLHVDTGKKYEDTLLATLRIDEILVNKSEYSVLDVDGRSGCVSVMLSSGDVKEDLSLGKSEDGMGWDTVGIELLKRFEDGEEIKVVVQEILGKEYILEVRAD